MTASEGTHGDVVCVAGMHRSGTSLATSWLAACGVVVDDGRRIGASEHNPHGHFEDLDFVELHSRAIREASWASEGWKVDRARPLRFSPALGAVADGLLAARAGKYRRWGWKDPRTTLFLDEWRARIPHVRFLLVWRPWTEVVDSLVRRSRSGKGGGIDPVRAVTVWAAYNRLALAFRQAHPDHAVLVPIHTLVARDEDVRATMVARFGLTLASAPIASLVDGDLLRETRHPGRRAWLAGRVLGVGELESALWRTSDVR